MILWNSLISTPCESSKSSLYLIPILNLIYISILRYIYSYKKENIRIKILCTGKSV